MPALHKLSLAMVCVALSGCMSMPVESLKKPAPEKAAELLITRSPSFFAGGVTAAVGTQYKAFVHLDNREYAIIQLPAGDHEIFVRARTAAPISLDVTLKAGQRTCMRIRADDADTASKTIGLLARIRPGSLLTEGYFFIPYLIDCPEDEKFFSAYKQVKIQYAEEP